jgi:hypothetical protein
MSKDTDNPRPGLRTTPVDRPAWSPWIAILAAVLVAALAWSFWSIMGRSDSRVPPAQTTIQPSAANSTPPATTPTQ